MRAHFLCVVIVLTFVCASRAALPFDTVFQGRARFAELVQRAESANWPALPIGERTAAVGRALAGTPYRSFTLEIDDHIEAPSVNLNGVDCWTFFESSLAFARMLSEPRENWTPETMLHYVELDRYRGGHCDGGYLSRLHYLEDWLADNNRRGLIDDITRDLGAVKYPHDAREMTVGWRQYRYLRNDPALLGPLGRMEARVSSVPLYGVPKGRVAGIESRLQNGDIIGIISRDGPGLYSTSHVGLAWRDGFGTVHFLHASAPYNYGRVVVDVRLSNYLAHFSSDAAIIVGRPVK